MTIKLTKPYKEASPALISQRFGVNPNPIQPNGHTGTDMTPQSVLKATIMVAPCKVKITNLVDNLDIDYNSDTELRRGYGVAMQPLEGDFPANTFFLYWHCQPVFPVKINQVVERGEAVAVMGNSGYVMWGGQYVPISDRTKPPYHGTHVHYEYFIGDAIAGRTYMDVLPLIDFSLPIKEESILAGIAKIIENILNLFKK